jgi:DNA (cytosine-5)-methyltransferase 1
MTRTVIDLFCGAGGFTQGFVDAGFRPAWANDSDEWSVRTYNENFGKHAVCADIRDVTRHPERFGLPRRGRADVVVGGLPCQGFSNLGKRITNDPRNQLWRQFLRVIELVGPKVFVIENVPPLLKSEEFAEMCREALSLGYRSQSSGVLNAADYGVPQTRRRAIGIFSRVGPIALPGATHSDPRTGLPVMGLRPWVSVGTALKGIPLSPSHNGDVDGIDMFLRRERLHIGRNPTAISLARYRAVPCGGNRFDLQRRRPDLTPKCWAKKPQSTTDLFGRLWSDRPSVTIRTEFYKPEKGRYLHPTEHRAITHWEAARLQTFPSDFRFWGPKIEIARQIGNAVPCRLAKKIARAIDAQLEACRAPGRHGGSAGDQD